MKLSQGVDCLGRVRRNRRADYCAATWPRCGPGNFPVLGIEAIPRGGGCVLMRPMGNIAWRLTEGPRVQKVVGNDYCEKRALAICDLQLIRGMIGNVNHSSYPRSIRVFLWTERDPSEAIVTLVLKSRKWGRRFRWRRPAKRTLGMKVAAGISGHAFFF